ncbi:MAG: cysteine--tRNA ligase [Prevotellaceae bacterium]|jgi:cysteinyl-tRNA synthetase|nr:cysteine--tRNA ligase [Prevotellaceae bacterium]
MSFTIYSTLSRKKEIFEPVNPPYAGMYVCGPTVYGDPHLGHARSAITFDVLFRYLTFLGYKVRYVRNITDVGHLENDADNGEDKLLKKARLEQLEPMEVAKYYTDRYHDMMDALNVRRPSIEPNASGHIIEQIDMVQQILDAGFAYVVNGSVYFDVVKYNSQHHYGILSGRILDDLQSATRDNLEGQEEKRNSADFALWKKAQPEHIMRWKSPWSDGFPGWHLECSAMGRKYLGEQFDIHGGGMDLLFPHHESEIAQSEIANGKQPCRYWMHNNMITVNGQKMGKSLGNSIMLEEFFTGNHRLLEQAYNPMTVRFFILQAHYRSTLDFSNEALQAAEKGLKRLMQAAKTLENIRPTTDAADNENIKTIEKECYEALNDDLNTPIAISQLFEAVRIINSVADKKEKINENDIEILKKMFKNVVDDILGLKEEQNNNQNELVNNLIKMILDVRQQSKDKKDWATSDKIRDELVNLGIVIKDTKDGTEWEI